MAPLLRFGPALLLALYLPEGLAANPASQPGAPAAAVRSAAFKALNRCSSERKQESCREAQSALEVLIRQEEGLDQRLRQPRCLGALTQVETVLSAFRWRLENSGNLQQVVNAADGQCPMNESSATVGQ